MATATPRRCSTAGRRAAHGARNAGRVVRTAPAGRVRPAHRVPLDRHRTRGRQRGGGEFAAIFYDADRLEPLAYDHVWLSDTPREIGSATWGNTCVRMMTWVRLADTETGRELLVANTHLDHAVRRAQDEGARLVRKELEAASTTGGADLPVILTGDFNVPAGDSVPYAELTGWLRDSRRSADERLTPEYATCHGYGDPSVDGPRIDWILTRDGVRVRSAAINTFAAGPGRGSDHFPVQALVELG